MQSISNADILDMLLFVEERINTTIERCGSVISVNDFLASPVIGLRNIISHEYLSIDPEEIFKIVKVYLPGLLLAIQQIRNDIAASI